MYPKSKKLLKREQSDYGRKSRFNYIHLMSNCYYNFRVKA